ncbi:hypothetical protein LOK49_LG06G02783 [Camellia lanceoleosa]|uniref:Uncharacterized protein n=1 Tax=Camellia lanceoleosa TaxID=1840588 RepID=A0ACC0HBP8_9ERIC|nr:hypothetical protein LOK49_LG06G02783 [Camellia lanceoleosa]
MPEALCPGKAAWPELLGAQGKIAAATIEREKNYQVKAVILLIGTFVTGDFVCTRVRVWVDKSGIVVKVPVAVLSGLLCCHCFSSAGLVLGVWVIEGTAVFAPSVLLFVLQFLVFWFWFCYSAVGSAAAGELVEVDLLLVCWVHIAVECEGICCRVHIAAGAECLC